MQEALTAKTFARAEEAGYNDGYTLILGKWMYQVMRGTSVDKSTVFDLCSTEQYREMRQKMEREGVGVLVWHEVVWKAVQSARRAAGKLD